MADYTPNYQLHQWVAQDPFLRTDFNQDLQKIDAALGKHDQLTAAHAAVLPKLGNCMLCMAEYIGGGTSKPISHTFPHKPMVIIITDLDSSNYSVVACNGIDSSIFPPESQLAMTWSGKRATWFYGGSSSGGMDYPGNHYRIMALLDASE